MEKKKQIRRSRWIQILCLTAFAGMALACASQKDAVDFMDGFVDGYNSTRNRSDIEIPKDTVTMSSEFDYALIDSNK